MAVETNKTNWVKNFSNAIGNDGGSNPSPQPEGGEGGNTDKYAALETTSYKDMLSSKIQASNAKDQAMKYASASLGASGFGGQGMAESTRAGIINNYNKAIAGADEQHQQNLLDIETQKAEEEELKGEDNWQSVMTMMSQATSQEDLDYLKNEFRDGMTPEQQKMFDYYYSSYSNSFGGINDEFATYADQANALKDKAFNLDEEGNITGIKNEIAAARYNYYMMQQNGYYVQGLSDGRENDDIDITIGKDSRDKSTEFDLRAGKAVSKAMSNNLTKATGMQQPDNGTLIVYGNNLYIYTKSGWKEVLDDHSSVKKAVEAFKKLGIYTSN